jgi:Ca2+-binding RTX toxin-like protein
MEGGIGNDIYVVDDAGDAVVELAGGGDDRVKTAIDYVLPANVEQVRAIGGITGVDLTGNGLNNRLDGNAGNNTLDGRGGYDVLTGKGGADSFVFRDALEPPNIDRITDFNVNDDTIELESAVFRAIKGTGMLTAAQFAANASGTAVDASDRIIYETDTGKLFYDSNGSAAGGATQFAVLSPHLELTNSDFFII